MEIVIGIVILAAFAAFLIMRARKPNVPPVYTGEPPRDATADEVAEYWRNRANGE